MSSWDGKFLSYSSLPTVQQNGREWKIRFLRLFSMQGDFAWQIARTEGSIQLPVACNTKESMCLFNVWVHSTTNILPVVALYRVSHLVSELLSPTALSREPWPWSSLKHIFLLLSCVVLSLMQSNKF